MSSFLNHPQHVKWVYAPQARSEPFLETFARFCSAALEGWVNFSPQGSKGCTGRMRGRRSVIFPSFPSGLMLVKVALCQSYSPSLAIQNLLPQTKL